ncbi:MAG: hypothetical protein KDD62_11270, partial [Bdellovibrionales bacterium]|nr:hypothetical protein [Bdellovibrionales bacterium]
KSVLPGAPAPQLFRFRDLHITIGLTQEGGITWQNPATTLFSVTAQGRYVFQSLTPKLECNGIIDPQKHLIPYGQRQCISCGELRFDLICTRASAELQRVKNVTSFSKFQLVISMGPLHKIYPLPENEPVTIGSSPSADIPLLLPHMAPEHCSVYVSNDDIEVSSKDGPIGHSATPDGSVHYIDFIHSNFSVAIQQRS